jgi:hypothetical protein
MKDVHMRDHYRYKRVHRRDCISGAVLCQEENVHKIAAIVDENLFAKQNSIIGNQGSLTFYWVEWT